MPWTDEKRQAARERCLRTKPWTRSTGPVTAEGKLVSSMNNLKHGLYAKASSLRFLAAMRHRQEIYEEVKTEIEEILRTAKLLEPRNPALHGDLVAALQKINSQLSSNSVEGTDSDSSG